MKRKLLAVLISVALIVTIMVPVLGTMASEVETTAAPESPAAEETKQTEVQNDDAKQTEVGTQTTPASAGDQVSASDETQAPNQTDLPAATEATADPTAASTDAPAATDAQTAEPTSAPSEGATAEPTVETTAAPSAEPTAVPELNVGISANQRSAFSGDGISASIHVEGGAAPYSVKVTVSRGGEVLSENTYAMAAAGDLNAAAVANKFGEHIFSAVITDANGNSKSVSASVPVAVKEIETPAEWEATMSQIELSGDWREDILAIARTQLGYHESNRNFIVCEDGIVRGWTRYGALSGTPYEDWCAMFVSFCLEYAEIPAADYPRDSGCESWRKAMDALGAFESRQSGYEPQPGDLVFFNRDEERDADHMGIIESVGAGWINVIEGNSESQVRTQGYALNDDQIIGYGNTTKLMDRAGALEETKPVAIGDLEGSVAAINTDGVNLREMPTTVSKVLAVLNKDASVTLIGAVESYGKIWYLVKTDEIQGYVRGDLLTIAEPETDVEEETTDMNGVKPSGESWLAGQESVSFGFEVDGAESYVWQRGGVTAEGVAEWEDIPGSNTPDFLCAATLENMKYAYRCVVTTADGTEIVSGEATMIDPELVRWMNEEDVDETMLVRALGAKSLESMIFEGNNLVYVRTGEIVAVYNPETTELVDRHYNLTVATVDMESQTILPVASEASEQE